MGYNNVVKTLHLLIVICKKNSKLTENEKHTGNAYDLPGGKACSSLFLLLTLFKKLPK